jgi:glycosyltransferase involved in cell wall biosynthesis
MCYPTKSLSDRNLSVCLSIVKSKKKRILWVSFDFPPRLSSGAFRPIKIYKYMDKERFEVDFLTHSLRYKFKNAARDESLLSEVSPEPRVYRLPPIIIDDIIRALANAMRSKKAIKAARALFGSGSAPAEAAPVSLNRPLETSYQQPTLKKRIYRLFVMLLYFPDQFVVWGWLAAFTAVRLQLTHRYDAVYTTSYPESAHLAGLALRLLGVKWVVDYRYGGCLWNKQMLGYPKKGIRQAFDLLYQKTVVRRAHYVVVQHDTIKEDFCHVFSVPEPKVKAIPSGFDEDDFTRPDVDDAPFPRTGNELHLLHSGAWYLNDGEIEKMIEALNMLSDGLSKLGRKLVLNALGDDLFTPTQKANQIRFEYVFHGVLAHQDLARHYRAADCYLLSTIATTNVSRHLRGVELVSLSNSYMPSKVWEYLRGAKPILFSGPKDETWEILEEAGTSLYMGLLDKPDLPSSRELLAAVERSKPLNATVARHSWEERARALQDVFEQVLDEHGDDAVLSPD